MVVVAEEVVVVVWLSSVASVSGSGGTKCCQAECSPRDQIVQII